MDLSQEDWVSKLNADENAVILDVRSEEEVEDGYIPLAQNIDIRQGQGFIDGLQALDASKNYYVYCRSGARSAQACQIMNQMGFDTTYNLLGGILDWQGETVTP
ncbi:rhodanese-like domain-containing protein [Spongiivirga citrea]|uniref:Rhodanese-like domain-containing protein n=1 Tax=Spongiivirga citrea TaxID=1481457 RepID=A0A6M0CNB3_9FLAO|nr:rhodanese-like domain-containing protein [Spongiivirga citrea]NER18433.1 rhodanese-like domain-containing protein [Spongiivirga citrea]